MHYKGSNWRKFDFHVHTPASNDYKCSNTTEIDILKAAMAVELDAIVIADHNSGSYFRLSIKLWQ